MKSEYRVETRFLHHEGGVELPHLNLRVWGVVHDHITHPETRPSTPCRHHGGFDREMIIEVLGDRAAEFENAPAA